MVSKFKLFILKWRCYFKSRWPWVIFIENKVRFNLFLLFYWNNTEHKQKDHKLFEFIKPLYFNHTVLTYKICNFLTSNKKVQKQPFCLVFVDELVVPYLSLLFMRLSLEWMFWWVFLWRRIERSIDSTWTL